MRISTKTVYKGPSVQGNKLICGSLFRMKKSYRMFDKYLGRCRMFIDMCKRILPDFIVRIYLDDSVRDEELETLKDEHVEIVKYHCEDFWDSESGTHEGVFGTFVRMLPVFSAKKYDVVISSDIDVYPFHVDSLKLLNQKADQIGLLNTSCHSKWIPAEAEYSILAGASVYKVVFPRQLLTRYLEHVRDGKIELQVVKSTDENTILPYGADEFFLNTIVANYIKLNKIHVMTITLSTVMTAVRQVLKSVKDKETIATIEKPIRILDHLDAKLWTNPIELKDDAFYGSLKKVLPVIKDHLVDSKYVKCIKDYLSNPKVIKMKKYNY